MREVLHHNGTAYYPYTEEQYLKVITHLSPINEGLKILREGEQVSVERHEKMGIRFGRNNVYALIVSHEGQDHLFPCVIVKTEDLVESLL